MQISNGMFRFPSKHVALADVRSAGEGRLPIGHEIYVRSEMDFCADSIADNMAGKASSPLTSGCRRLPGVNG